ncbi:MAG: DUF1599 domain-containing protein [Oscillospiraceae bacterium]|jgi:hypothetical protein|nr:DUF1599 domain-containing protein [Oscillospiraceae bacterium]
MSMETLFDETLGVCRAIFTEKLLDYGPTWLVFRWVSLIDQIWIKLRRLRTLEQADTPAQVADTPADEYHGVINYCVIGLMKASGALPGDDAVLADPALLHARDTAALLACYDGAAACARALLLRKNHDYGGAWRGMAVPSITDQMLVKTLRIKHILLTRRAVPEPDGIAAQLSDILNYCLFSLALLTERSQ